MIKKIFVFCFDFVCFAFFFLVTTGYEKVDRETSKNHKVFFENKRFAIAAELVINWN